MILTAHILAGAAVAEKIKNPLLGLFLAFMSHYFLDFLPHWEYPIEKIKKRLWKKSFFNFMAVFLDMASGFLVVFFISKNLMISVAGGFVAIIPDGLAFLHLAVPRNSLLKKHFENCCRKIHPPYLYLKKSKPLFTVLGLFVETCSTLIAVISLLKG